MPCKKGMSVGEKSSSMGSQHCERDKVKVPGEALATGGKGLCGCVPYLQSGRWVSKRGEGAIQKKGE